MGLSRLGPLHDFCHTGLHTTTTLDSIAYSNTIVFTFFDICHFPSTAKFKTHGCNDDYLAKSISCLRTEPGRHLASRPDVSRPHLRIESTQGPLAPNTDHGVLPLSLTPYRLGAVADSPPKAPCQPSATYDDNLFNYGLASAFCLDKLPSFGLHGLVPVQEKAGLSCRSLLTFVVYSFNA